MEKNTGPMPFIFYQDAYLWVLAYLTNEKKRLPERPSVLYVTRSSFIFSVVKFLWNRLSLRLFILLAFTFWSRNLAFFLLILCSEVVLLLTRFILFSREYQLNWELTTPRSEVVWSSGFDWLSVLWIDASLNHRLNHRWTLLKPCVIKLRYGTTSKRWKLWFIPHPKIPHLVTFAPNVTYSLGSYTRVRNTHDTDW